MSKFKEGVINVVRLVPYGRVVSYGQVALYIGVPRAARQVGWILRGLDANTQVPWWRVVNNEGRVSIKHSKFNAQEQRKILKEEGILVREDFTFEIDQYRFVPDRKFIKKLEFDPMYLSMVSEKIPYTRPHFARTNVRQ